MAKAIKKAWVVMVGSLEESPEAVEVVGVFTKEKDAYNFRNGEYKSMNDIDDEDEDNGPDLNSCFIDDGHQFWMIQETVLG
jgi:hypothetical protein